MDGVSTCTSVKKPCSSFLIFTVGAFNVGNVKFAKDTATGEVSEWEEKRKGSILAIGLKFGTNVDAAALSGLVGNGEKGWHSAMLAMLLLGETFFSKILA